MLGSPFSKRLRVSRETPHALGEQHCGQAATQARELQTLAEGLHLPGGRGERALKGTRHDV